MAFFAFYSPRAYTDLAMSTSLPAYAEGQYPRVGWLFLDLNSYFASVEQQDRPELRGRPLCVGGLRGDRGIVACPNYEARAYGVAVEGLREEMEALGLVIEPFDAADAKGAARLWGKTRPHS